MADGTKRMDYLIDIGLNVTGDSFTKFYQDVRTQLHNASVPLDVSVGKVNIEKGVLKKAGDDIQTYLDGRTFQVKPKVKFKVELAVTDKEIERLVNRVQTALTTLNTTAGKLDSVAEGLEAAAKAIKGIKVPDLPGGSAPLEAAPGGSPTPKRNTGNKEQRARKALEESQKRAAEKAAKKTADAAELGSKEVVAAIVGSPNFTAENAGKLRSLVDQQVISDKTSAASRMLATTISKFVMKEFGVQLDASVMMMRRLASGLQHAPSSLYRGREGSAEIGKQLRSIQTDPNVGPKALRGRMTQQKFATDPNVSQLQRYVSVLESKLAQAQAENARFPSVQGRVGAGIWVQHGQSLYVPKSPNITAQSSWSPYETEHAHMEQRLRRWIPDYENASEYRNWRAAPYPGGPAAGAFNDMPDFMRGLGVSIRPAMTATVKDIQRGIATLFDRELVTAETPVSLSPNRISGRYDSRTFARLAPLGMDFLNPTNVGRILLSSGSLKAHREADPAPGAEKIRGFLATLKSLEEHYKTTATLGKGAAQVFAEIEHYLAYLKGWRVANPAQDRLLAHPDFDKMAQQKFSIFRRKKEEEPVEAPGTMSRRQFIGLTAGAMASNTVPAKVLSRAVELPPELKLLMSVLQGNRDPWLQDLSPSERLAGIAGPSMYEAIGGDLGFRTRTGLGTSEAALRLRETLTAATEHGRNARPEDVDAIVRALRASAEEARNSAPAYAHQLELLGDSGVPLPDRFAELSGRYRDLIRRYENGDTSVRLVSKRGLNQEAHSLLDKGLSQLGERVGRGGSPDIGWLESEVRKSAQHVRKALRNDIRREMSRELRVARDLRNMLRTGSVGDELASELRTLLQRFSETVEQLMRTILRQNAKALPGLVARAALPVSTNGPYNTRSTLALPPSSLQQQKFAAGSNYFQEIFDRYTAHANVPALAAAGRLGLGYRPGLNGLVNEATESGALKTYIGDVPGVNHAQSRFMLGHELGHLASNTAYTYREGLTKEGKFQTAAQSDLLGDLFGALTMGKGDIRASNIKDSYYTRLFGASKSVNMMKKDLDMLAKAGVDVDNFDISDIKKVKKLFEALSKLGNQLSWFNENMTTTGRDSFAGLYGLSPRGMGRRLNSGVVGAISQDFLSGNRSGVMGQEGSALLQQLFAAGGMSPQRAPRPMGGRVGRAVARVLGIHGQPIPWDDSGGPGVPIRGSGLAVSRHMPSFTAGTTPLGRVGSAFERLGSYYLAGGAIRRIQSALQTFRQSISEVDLAMQNLNRMLNLNQAELGKTRDSLLDVAQKYGLAFDKVAEISKEYAKQGMAGKTLLGMTDKTSMFVNVSGMESEPAVRSITAARKQMNLTMEDTNKLMDQWVALSQSQRVEAKDLAQGFGQVAALAKNAGFGMTELNAVMAATTAVSDETGENVGNAFRSILSRLTNPNTQVKKAFRSVNIDVESKIGKAPELLKELAARWDKFTPGEKQIVAQAAAEKRRAQVFFALMQAMRDTTGYSKAYQSALHSEGAMAKANAQVMQSYTKLVEQARMAWMQFAVEAGDAGLLAVLKTIATAMRGLLDLFQMLPKPIKLFTVALGVMFGTAVAGLEVASWLGWKITTVKSIAAVTGATGGLTEQNMALAQSYFALAEAATAAGTAMNGESVAEGVGAASAFVSQSGRKHVGAVLPQDLARNPAVMESAQVTEAFAKSGSRYTGEVADAAIAVVGLKAASSQGGKLASVFSRLKDLIVGGVTGAWRALVIGFKFLLTPVGALTAGLALLSLGVVKLYQNMNKRHEETVKAREHQQEIGPLVEEYTKLQKQAQGGTLPATQWKRYAYLGRKLSEDYSDLVTGYDPVTGAPVLSDTLAQEHRAKTERLNAPDTKERWWMRQSTGNPYYSAFQQSYWGGKYYDWREDFSGGLFRGSDVQGKRDLQKRVKRDRNANDYLEKNLGATADLFDLLAQEKGLGRLSGTAEQSSYNTLKTLTHTSIGAQDYGYDVRGDRGAYGGHYDFPAFSKGAGEILGRKGVLAKDVMDQFKQRIPKDKVKDFKNWTDEAISAYLKSQAHHIRQQLKDSKQSAKAKPLMDQWNEAIGQLIGNLKSYTDGVKTAVEKYSPFLELDPQEMGIQQLYGVQSQYAGNLYTQINDTYDSGITDFKSTIQKFGGKMGAGVATEISGMLSKGDIKGALSKLKVDSGLIGSQLAEALSELAKIVVERVKAINMQVQAEAASVYSQGSMFQLMAYEQFGTSFGLSGAQLSVKQAKATASKLAGTFDSAKKSGDLATAQAAYKEYLKYLGIWMKGEQDINQVLDAEDQKRQQKVQKAQELAKQRAEDARQRRKDAQERAKQLWQSWFSGLQEYLGFLQNTDQATTAQAYLLTKKLHGIAKTPQERLQLEQQAFTLKKQVYDERWQGAQGWLQHETSMERISTKTQIRIWQRMLAYAKRTGDKQKIWEAEENIYRLRQEEANKDEQQQSQLSGKYNELAKAMFRRAAKMNGPLAIGLAEYRAAMGDEAGGNKKDKGLEKSKKDIKDVGNQFAKFTSYMADDFGGMTTHVGGSVDKLWNRMKRYAASVRKAETDTRATQRSINDMSDSTRSLSPKLKTAAQKGRDMGAALDHMKDSTTGVMTAASGAVKVFDDLKDAVSDISYIEGQKIYDEGTHKYKNSISDTGAVGRAFLKAFNNNSYLANQATAVYKGTIQALNEWQKNGGGLSTGGPTSTAHGSGPLNMPVPGGKIISGWGAQRVGHKHQGVDIAAPYGTPIKSFTSGQAHNRTGGLGGNTVGVTDPDGNYFYYAHLSRYALKGGGYVSAGQVIGYVGTSGNARGTTPHLHFQYHPGHGRAVNPYNYVMSHQYKIKPQIPVRHAGGTPASQDDMLTLVHKKELLFPRDSAPALTALLQRMNHAIAGGGSNGSSVRVPININLTLPNGEVVSFKEEIVGISDTEIQINRILGG